MIPEDTRDLYKAFKLERDAEAQREYNAQLYKPLGFGLETGNYQCIAVLTHKGRTADSGHYVGWVHKGGGFFLNSKIQMIGTNTMTIS